MKKAFAVMFLLLLFLQAIPVGHFFALEKSIFYAYVDEDKPDNGQPKCSKDCRDELSAYLLPLLTGENTARYQVLSVCLLPPPYLDFFTPPPDGTC